MDSRKFEEIVKKIAVTELIVRTGIVTWSEEDVFIVWQAKILQNNKAIVAADNRHKLHDGRGQPYDGVMYEITYNGDKQEIYVDCYDKEYNKSIPYVEK